MIKEWWIDRHRGISTDYLGNSSAEGVVEFLELDSSKHGLFDKQLLNVGIGTGRCTFGFVAKGLKVSVLDICEEALNKVKDIVEATYLDSKDLPTNTFDYIVMHLVCQHITDEVFIGIMRDLLRAVKEDGIIAIQFADQIGETRSQDLKLQQIGHVFRSKEEMEILINKVGGKISNVSNKVFYHTPIIWYGMHIQR